MVSRYPVLNQQTTGEIHPSQTDNDNALGYPATQQQLGEPDGMYDELMSWVQSDGLRLHHNFSI
jgi:hypothetical protein